MAPHPRINMEGFETLQRLEQLLSEKRAQAALAVPASAAVPATKEKTDTAEELLPYGVSKVVTAIRRHDLERTKKKKKPAAPTKPI